MSNQQPYKLTHGTHTSVQEERRVRIEPGVVFVPSDVELKAFGDRLERVEGENPSLAINPQLDGNSEGTGEGSDQPLDSENDENPKSLEQDPSTESNKEEADGESSSADSEQEEWPKHTGSGWYELPNGEKIQGKEKADEKYQALTEEQSAE